MSTTEVINPPVLPHTEIGPLSPAEQRKVMQQLNRLLDSSLFKNSRRYPALLRFIVEETLEGRGEYLKERLLGIRVFDRPADYDTAADPIVRVTIAEVRKRIAQYYHDEEHDAEIRIELLPGRYAPEFRARRDTHTAPEAAISSPSQPAEASPAEALPATLAVQPSLATEAAAQPQLVQPISSEPETPAASATPRRTAPRKLWIALGSIAACLLVLAYAFAPWLRASPTDQLWAPLLASSHPILFCIPTGAGRTSSAVAASLNSTYQSGGLPATGRLPVTPNGTTFLDHESLGENVVYSDMLATLDIANIITLHRHEYSVRLTTSTTLDDLRGAPSVLVGGMDNQWTMRAVDPLRYRFQGSDEAGFYIEDKQAPGNHQWSLDLKQQISAVTRDYAIVARIHNEQTGQPQMVVAGIGMSGTAAGGEFVASEKSLTELRRRLGPDFKDHDFEVILSTDVVNGIAGFPKILAAVSVR